MGCQQCMEKKTEEEKEINNEDDSKKDDSEPEIQNPFNPEEYENVILAEKKEVEEEITNLGSNFQNENEQIQNNKFNNITLDLINQARRNPQAYANKILENLQYIINEHGKLVFKKKVKVLLNRGEAAFREAADELNNISPMDELVMKPEIIIPLPESEEEMNDNNMLRNKVIKIRENYNINVYFKNMIKNPEIAVLLLIVDDSVNNPGKKRKAILNPEFKKIGIDSTFLGNTFISHFSFSK
jgi:hypothetical protein